MPTESLKCVRGLQHLKPSLEVNNSGTKNKNLGLSASMKEKVVRFITATIQIEF